MKRKLLLSILFIAFTGFIFANKVNVQDAKKVAFNYYFQSLTQYYNTTDYKNLEITETFVINENNIPVYYVFNFRDLGFIIVSAEDALEPVLGYSFDRLYFTENQPENFSGLMREYIEHINYLRENNIQASIEINNKWEQLLTFEPTNYSIIKDAKDVEPLLTCLWNQDYPYNFLCPEDPQGSGGHVYVGCVATAMAQIMYYWRYPLQGTGQHSYSWPPYGTIYANFGATEYQWDGMVNSSDSKVNLPIAEIGFHCAVSVDMQFGWDGSGAYSDEVDNALHNYFSYSQAQYLQRGGYPLNTWKQMVKGQLDEAKPVYYSGREGSSGHAFVLDGYHSFDEMFHFNFGWSGSMNGWFLITDAGGFSTLQAMVWKFFPTDNYPYYCTGEKNLTHLVGTFEDGSGPQEDYENNTDCSWLITPQTEEDSVTNITLEFYKFETESGNDIVTVYDGGTTNDPVLGTFSGSTIPEDLTSTGNKMLITFVTNGSSTAQGWLAGYTTNLPVWCSGLTTYTEPTGSFGDGSGSFFYNNGSTCMWKIEPQWANELTVTFTSFDTEEDEDFVKIFDADNSQLLATYSGYYPPENLPAPVTSPSGEIFLTFSSNMGIRALGWELDYTVGNTGIEDNYDFFTDLMIFPNPTNNILNLSFAMNEMQSVHIKLSTVTGEVVYKENTENVFGNYHNTIDLSGFSKGIYFLSLTNDNGTVNKKIIIK
ncbi:MAG: C10 family peptidase [Bacteroidales bacterium]|nr:C10 family peptidase [Bacteroidales bacterium]